MSPSEHFHVKESDNGYDVVHATMGKIVTLPEYMDCVDFIGNWVHLSDEAREIILLTEQVL